MHVWCLHTCVKMFYVCPFVYKQSFGTTMQFPTNALSHRPTLLHYIMDGRIKVPPFRLNSVSMSRTTCSAARSPCCLGASVHSLDDGFRSLAMFMHAGKPPARWGTRVSVGAGV